MKNQTMQVELIAITPDPESVIELAGRTCYMSYHKIGANSGPDFIKRLIEMGHESPLEHAYATFKLTNCSRAMTHQLVRHRLMAVSQQSQRYTCGGDFDYVIPQNLDPSLHEEFENDMLKIKDMYLKYRQKGLKKEDARFVLPNSCVSQIVVSANFREWRHIFKTRIHPKAQWEIRNACKMMLEVLRRHSPSCFSDYN